jgi:hypothetical protein
MATPTHIPSLPDVEIQQNAEFDEQLAEHLQLLIERIKETLEVWAGRRGQYVDHLISQRELEAILSGDESITVTVSILSHNHDTIYFTKKQSRLQNYFHAGF